MRRTIATTLLVLLGIACARAKVEPSAGRARAAARSGSSGERELSWLAPAPAASLVLTRTEHDEIPQLYARPGDDTDKKERDTYLAQHPGADTVVADAAAWKPTTAGLAVAKWVAGGVELALYPHDAQLARVSHVIAFEIPQWMEAEERYIWLDGHESGAWIAVRVADAFLEIVSGEGLASVLHVDDDAKVELVSDERVVWVVSGCVCEGKTSRRHRVLLLEGTGARPVIELAERDSGYHWSGTEYALDWSRAGVFWAYSPEAVTTWDLAGNQVRVPLHGLVDDGDLGLSGEYYADDYETMWPTILRVAGPESVELLTWRGTTLRFVSLSATSAVERGRVDLADVQQLAWAEDGEAWVRTTTGVMKLQPPH